MDEEYLRSIKSYNFDFKNCTYGIFLSKLGLKKDIKILEIGVGQGRHIISLKRLGYNNLYSTDISDYYKHFLENINIKFTKNNIESEKLIYKKNYFDVIIFSHVIEHLNNIDNAFNEFKRVLKPNGIILIETPNYLNSWKWFWDDPTHIRPYTKVTLERLSKTYRFKILNLKNIGISKFIFSSIYFIISFYNIFKLNNKKTDNEKKVILTKIKIPLTLKLIEDYLPNILKSDNLLLIAKNEKK